jgi:hypothetical protein
MFRKADDWLLAKVEKLVLYLARYFNRSGRHRPERIFGR